MNNFKKLIIIDYLNDQISNLLDEEVLTYTSDMEITKKEDETLEENLKSNNEKYREFIRNAHETLSKINDLNSEIMELIGPMVNELLQGEGEDSKIKR